MLSALGKWRAHNLSGLPGHTDDWAGPERLYDELGGARHDQNDVPDLSLLPHTAIPFPACGQNTQSRDRGILKNDHGGRRLSSKHHLPKALYT